MGFQWEEQSHVHVLIWVRLKLNDTVNRAQQPGRDNVRPAAPGFGATWIRDSDVLVHAHRPSAIFVGWKIHFRDEQDDVILDPLCVRLFGLVRNRLDLKLK